MRTRSKYIIDKSFFTRLALYFILTFLILTIFIGSVVSFCYLAGIPISGMPDNVCEEGASAYNFIYCFFFKQKDGKLYWFLYYFLIVLTIAAFLCLVIVNIFYIANRFYFQRLVKEKSCGAVIYKIEHKKVYYLLLKMNYGHTSLCKGHQEVGETNAQTAIREIKEETNLDIDLNMDFVSKIKYKPSDLIIKDVYFYLATPKDNNAVAQDLHDQEVKDFEWCDYNEALFKITYDLDRDVIKKAHRYIKKHNLVLK